MGPLAFGLHVFGLHVFGLHVFGLNYSLFIVHYSLSKQRFD